MDRVKNMSAALKTKILLLTWIVCTVFTSLHSISVANNQPTPTSLTIRVSTNPPWLSCTMAATLTDENDTPLQGVDIDLLWTHRLDDGAICGPHLLCRAKTNSNGVAYLTENFWSAGTYNVSARFSGTTDYAQSSSEYIDIVIVDYSQPLTIGGITTVVAIGVVAYIYYRRRLSIVHE